MRLRSGSIRIDRKLTSSALRRDLQQESIQAAAVINSATVKTVATQPASAPGGSLSARLSPPVSAQFRHTAFSLIFGRPHSGHSSVPQSKQRSNSARFHAPQSGQVFEAAWSIGIGRRSVVTPGASNPWKPRGCEAP